MENMKDVEGTYFDSVYQTGTSRPMSLSAYIAMVKGGMNAGTVCKLRDAKKAAQAAACEKWKKSLPLFVAGGRMEGGRRLEHLKAYSQCIPVDIDESAVAPAEILRVASVLPYVKAGNISPGGEGVKLFVLVDSDLQHHAWAFELVRRHIEADIPGVIVDISGKDANRGCFIGYDPTAFFKEEADALHVPTADPSLPAQEPVPVPPAATPQSLAHYIDKFEANNPFTGGSRHTYVVHLASSLNCAGFPHFEVASECVRRYTLPDFSQAEIEATVADIYRRYAGAHGSNVYQAKEEPSRRNLKTLKNFTPTSRNALLEEADDKDLEIQLDNRLLPCFKDSVYEHLPSLLADALMKAQEGVNRDSILLTALTTLSSAVPHVTGSLAKGEYFAPLYFLLIGPSGSGKGASTALHKLVEPWHEYVYQRSREEVLKNEELKMEYEAYLQNRKKKGRQAAEERIFPPERPKEVKQKNLNLFGYVTLARLLELLQDNSPYASLLFETEMESLIHTMQQDFGGYGYVLNQAAHHERTGNDSKLHGAFVAARPQLAIFAAGTDEMARKLIPSTENGTFSRMLIYKLVGRNPYQPLDSSDDTLDAAHYYDALGLRMLDIAKHLDGSPTFVKYTNAQRKRLDRFFESEYNKVRAFNNEDLISTVFRHRLAMFRIVMTLTAIRKGEALDTSAKLVVREDDFETGFEMIKVCLQHAYLVSTTLERGAIKVCYKFPYVQQKLFTDMPDHFKCSELLAVAADRGISKSTGERLLKRSSDIGLIVSLGGGYYEKTVEGKSIVSPDMP